MRENEFEKQVQKQLEDFQLNPSASVWEQVEDQIKKKKRRRRAVFYILLPVALALLGFLTNYYLFTGPKTEQSEKLSSAKNETSLTTDKTNIPSHSEKLVTNQSKEINKTDLTKKEITKDQKTNNVVKNDRQRVFKNISIDGVKKKSVIKHNNDTRVQKELDNSPVINNNVDTEQRVVRIKPATEADEKIEIDQNAVNEKIQKEDIVIADKDIEISKTDSAKTESPADNKNEAIAKKPVGRGGKTSKYKINWGVDFSVGITSNHNNIFSLHKSYAADVSYSNPPLGSSTGGNPASSIPPSSVGTGPSFKVGLAGEFQISKRSRFSTGLQYVYTSNRIRTGAKEDTTIQLQTANNFSSRIDRVYRGTQKNSYTNRYHFIQVPFWYHWQINKGKKLPVQWNIGASFGYMFATNGLVYNSGYGGIYYQDKKAFTKIHFNLSSGLSFRLKSKNRMEWVIGPEISFDISPLMKNDNKQYLLYGGLNTKLFFLKKKNK
jgi:hypothetical protein